MRQKCLEMPFIYRTYRHAFSCRGQRPFRPYSVIMIFFLFMILVFSESRLFPFVFFVLPFLFVWFVSTMFSIFFRRVSRGVEDFWKSHLEDEEDPLLEEQASYSQQEEIPESVRNNNPLRMIWERAMALRNEQDLQRSTKNVLRQVHALADLFERFGVLLKTKLSPDELTYRRFLTSATQGYEMIVEELRQTLSRMEHLQSVGTSLRPTADDPGFSSQVYQEIQQEQLSQIGLRLSQTQEAIAQLARVNITIAQMRGVSARREGDISNAIHELKDLANRAKQL